MKPTLIACAALLVAGFSLAMACSGGTANVEFISHDKQDAGVDAAGSGGSGGGNTATGSSGTGGQGGGTAPGNPCAGPCIPMINSDWDGPVLLWFGPEDQFPGCPPQTPVDNKTAYTGLVAPHNCDACACAPSTATCKLPSKITAHSELCYMGGQEFTMDAPDPWDGSCTDLNAIPPQPDCTNNPCIKSVTVDTISILDEKCAPSAVPGPNPLPPPTWQTVAKACYEQNTEYFCDKGTACAPVGEPGFKTCFYWKEDDNIQACPGPYERYVFYAEVDDQRTCTECSCGAPAGSLCSAGMYFYEDAACSIPLPYPRPVSSMFPLCADFAPLGAPFGSKEVKDLSYTPGTCEPSGGQPEGEAMLAKPLTFCCLKSAPVP